MILDSILEAVGGILFIRLCKIPSGNVFAKVVDLLLFILLPGKLVIAF